MTAICSPGRTYQATDEPLSVAVTRAVADLENTDATLLPPLYDSVDIEAVANLCRSLDGGYVTFTYQDYRITVEDSMEFTVEPV